MAFACCGLACRFQCILRTGELLSIVRRVTFAPDYSIASVDLGFTKGGQRRGQREAVVLDDPLLVAWLAAVFEQADPGTFLVPDCPAAFRRKFNVLLQDLQLDSRGYKPYSLRRGGATHLFRVCGQYSVVQARGRWCNARTAQVYIQEGAVVLDAITLPPAASRMIREKAARITRFLS